MKTATESRNKERFPAYWGCPGVLDPPGVTVLSYFTFHYSNSNRNNIPIQTVVSRVCIHFGGLVNAEWGLYPIRWSNLSSARTKGKRGGKWVCHADRQLLENYVSPITRSSFCLGNNLCAFCSWLSLYFILIYRFQHCSYVIAQIPLPKIRRTILIWRGLLLSVWTYSWYYLSIFVLKPSDLRPWSNYHPIISFKLQGSPSSWFLLGRIDAHLSYNRRKTRKAPSIH